MWQEQSDELSRQRSERRRRAGEAKQPFPEKEPLRPLAIGSTRDGGFTLLGCGQNRTIMASMEAVIVVLSGNPRSRPCRLASKSPNVVPAVRAATMLAQYQGFDMPPKRHEMTSTTANSAVSTAEP
jgi:hypothetical protein